MAARSSAAAVAVLLVAFAGPLSLPSSGQQSSRGSQSLTPEGVARAMEERDTGRDSRGEMRMRLFDRQGRMRERTLAIAALKGSGSRGDKTLVRFTYPNDIRGTAFLVWEHDDAADEDRKSVV